MLNNQVMRRNFFSSCARQRATSILALVLLPFFSMLPGNVARADNILTNPGFELDPAGETPTTPAWTHYSPGPVTSLSETGVITHSGSNYLKVFSARNSTVNFNGVYQDNISGPGAVYAADGWAYTSSTNKIAGGNLAWIEVTFRNATGGILSLYRSAILNNGMTDRHLDRPSHHQPI